MPTLELEQEMMASAERVLAVLGRIDQFQNFIPGCKESQIKTCERRNDNLWQATASYVYELKKYGVHEAAEFQFSIDEQARTVRFVFPENSTNGFSADAHYRVLDSGQNQSLLKLKLDYNTGTKRYFWLIAKPLIRRFFFKFTQFLDQRALQVEDTYGLSFDMEHSASEVDPHIRGFRQQDDRTYHARMKLLSRFEEGSVGAEIGTYMGAFAEHIIETVKPQKLYLIDPWTAAKSASHAGSWYETVDQDYMDDVYAMVSKRFADATRSHAVTILRDYSSNALSTLHDGELDWVYIDGDHSYEAVRADLELSFQKVRKGGFISGDDHEIVDKWWKDGVVRAVREFVETHPVEFELDEGSQFLLRKN